MFGHSFMPRSSRRNRVPWYSKDDPGNHLDKAKRSHHWRLDACPQSPLGQGDVAEEFTYGFVQRR